MLECIVKEPAQAAVASVIWLHGLGADGNDFVPLIPELRLPADLPIRFVFPHAPAQPVTINGGYAMRAWYDILEANLARKVDESGVKASAKAVMELIEREHARGIPYDKIFLAGFSQGGAITLHLGLRYPKTLGGLLALSTYVPVPEKLAAERSDAMRNANIFMAHGDYDPIVPLSLALESKSLLEQLGYQPQFERYPMPHSVCGEEVVAIREFLIKRLRAQ